MSDDDDLDRFKVPDNVALFKDKSPNIRLSPFLLTYLLEKILQRNRLFLRPMIPIQFIGIEGVGHKWTHTLLYIWCCCIYPESSFFWGGGAKLL